jgi:RNA polymerase sigma factor (sigma-70 family)
LRHIYRRGWAPAWIACHPDPTFGRYLGTMSAGSPVSAIVSNPDQLFLAYARDRDVHALESVLEFALQRAFAHARRMLGNAADAEDAVQEAVVRLVQTAHRYNGSVRFEAWLGRLVHDAAVRVMQAGARRSRRERDAQGFTPPRAAGDHDQVADKVRTAVGALPERYRAPIDLHYFAGLSTRDGAAALGMTENAFKVRLHRGRERLRSVMQRRGLAVSATVLVAALLEAPASAISPALTAAATSMVAQIAHGVTPTTALATNIFKQAWLAVKTHAFISVLCATAVVIGAGSATLSVYKRETALPAWRRAPMTPDRLHELPGTRISDAAWDKNFIDAWSGWAADSESGDIWVGLGGGSMPNQDNSMRRLTVTEDILRWTVERASTASGILPKGTSHYPDGSPACREVSYSAVATRRDGKPIVVYVGVAGYMDCYDVSKNDFDANGGDWQPISDYGPAARDPATDFVWCMSIDDTIQRLDPRTRQWTVEVSGVDGWAGISIAPQPVMFDPKRRVLIRAGLSAGLGRLRAFRTYAVDQRQIGLVHLNGDDAAYVQMSWENSSPWSALTYDSLNDRYLWAGSSMKIVAIDPDSGACTVLDTIPGRLPEGGSGLCGRFAFMPSVAGAFLMLNGASDLYFMPVR